jgi:hypothetical protein
MINEHFFVIPRPNHIKQLILIERLEAEVLDFLEFGWAGAVAYYNVRSLAGGSTGYTPRSN